MVHTRSEDVEDFTGPLDLILSLLSKNKMEIQDIQISLILDQYMAWMDKRRALDLEVASEFVTMASQLMFIKTRMLLSIHDEEAISELDQLIASLEEHRRHENYTQVQSVLPALSSRYEVYQNCITKGPEQLAPNKTYCYSHTPQELRACVLSILDRAGNQLPPMISSFEGIVGREPYPVADKAGEIMERLRHFGVTRFRTLFQGSRSRSEIVATFLAVLELCKARRLRLAGTEQDCTVTSVGEDEELLHASAKAE